MEVKIILSRASPLRRIDDRITMKRMYPKSMQISGLTRGTTKGMTGHKGRILWQEETRM